MKKKIEFVEGSVAEFTATLIRQDRVYRKLKKEYLAAVAANQKTFMDGMLLVAFCKYAFEYADGERKRLGKGVWDGKKWVR